MCEVEKLPDGRWQQKGQRRNYLSDTDGNEPAEKIAEEYFREFKQVE